MCKIYFDNADKLIEGIKLVTEELKFDVSDSADNADVTVTVCENGNNSVIVNLNDNKATISYGHGKVSFFRGLMLLCEVLNKGLKSYSITETPSFKSNGVQVDMARLNALNLKGIKFFIRQAAIMGLYEVSLYLEDMFDMKEYPYFGYMRGRYTKEEIREFCEYASVLGVQIIPNVEQFSHMEKFFGYDSSTPFKSTRTCLLVGAQATYDLIECIVKTITDYFNANKLIINCDEVFDANKGVYQQINGDRPLEDVFFEHMNKVFDILKKYNVEPIMANDMFFHLRNTVGFAKSHYPIVEEVDFDEDFFKKLPDYGKKIFWNYQEEDEEKMVRLMKLSQQISKNTRFLGAVRMWQSNIPQYTPTITNAIVGLNASKRAGIEEVGFATWEDSGEVPHFFAVATMLIYAQIDYDGNYDADDIDNKLRFLYNVGLDDFIMMEQADYVHQNGPYELATKFLLYNDPLIGLIDKEIEGVDTRAFYGKLVKDFESKGNSSCEPLKLSFDVYKCIIKLLELKADYGIRLKAAYDANDKKALAELADEALEIKKRCEDLRNTERELFTKYNRGCSYKKIDMRKSTIAARFDTAHYRIMAYLNGEIDEIDELKYEKLRYDHNRFECPNDTNIFFGTMFDNIFTEA